MIYSRQIPPPGAFVILGAALLLPCSTLEGEVSGWEVLSAPSGGADCVTLANDGKVAPIVVDANDFPVVVLAANLLADDLQRVCGLRPAVSDGHGAVSQAVIAGTLGHSEVIDRLVAAGKIGDIDKIKGRWEATLSEAVEQPIPGVERALVIVGSDRRGTAYGLTQLSERIGVSPWYCGRTCP